MRLRARASVFGEGRLPVSVAGGPLPLRRSTRQVGCCMLRSVISACFRLGCCMSIAVVVVSPSSGLCVCRALRAAL